MHVQQECLFDTLALASMKKMIFFSIVGFDLTGTGIDESQDYRRGLICSPSPTKPRITHRQ